MRLDNRAEQTGKSGGLASPAAQTAAAAPLSASPTDSSAASASEASGLGRLRLTLDLEGTRMWLDGQPVEKSASGEWPVRAGRRTVRLEKPG